MPDIPDEIKDKLKELGDEAREAFEKHLKPAFDNSVKNSGPFLAMLAQEIIEDNYRLLVEKDPTQRAVIEQSIALRAGVAELRAKNDGLVLVRAAEAGAKEWFEKAVGIAGALLKQLVKRVIPIP